MVHVDITCDVRRSMKIIDNAIHKQLDNIDENENELLHLFIDDDAVDRLFFRGWITKEQHDKIYQAINTKIEGEKKIACQNYIPGSQPL